MMSSCFFIETRPCFARQRAQFLYVTCALYLKCGQVIIHKKRYILRISYEILKWNPHLKAGSIRI